MCCLCFCIDSSPVDDETGRIRTFNEGTEFKTSMINAPCSSFSSFLFCIGQFIPCTMGVTQCLLRRKVLDNDMTRYSCGQGYFDCLCFKAGSCGESYCPNLCSFLEGCFCNCISVSASRIYLMDKYNLRSDPCDYRLIRINNCLQLASCICGILAIFVDELRQLSRILDLISNIFYHCVSGCMSSQVAFEIEQRLKDPHSEAVVIMNDGDDYGYDKNSILYIPPNAPNQESKSITI